MRIDDTHDPALQSWVESANEPGCDFPIQNLPFGIFRDRKKRGDDKDDLTRRPGHGHGPMSHDAEP